MNTVILDGREKTLTTTWYSFSLLASEIQGSSTMTSIMFGCFSPMTGSVAPDILSRTSAFAFDTLHFEDFRICRLPVLLSTVLFSSTFSTRAAD